MSNSGPFSPRLTGQPELDRVQFAVRDAFDSLVQSSSGIFVDPGIVTAPVIAPTNDLTLGGLDGDAAGVYFIQAEIVQLVSTPWTCLPNGTTTGVASNYIRALSGFALTSNVAAQWNVLTANGIASAFVNLWGILVSRTGRPRQWFSIAHDRDSANVELGEQVASGAWIDSTNKITSVVIHGAASSIGVGSYIRAQKLGFTI